VHAVPNAGPLQTYIQQIKNFHSHQLRAPTQNCRPGCCSTPGDPP